MQSITIGALIVIDVHAKDIVQRLWKEEVTNVEAFEWIAQLRYYWRDDNCWTQCVQTDFPYGYEYLGNTFRLVMTPLTDLAYMTLMGAQQLNLGERNCTSCTRFGVEILGSRFFKGFVNTTSFESLRSLAFWLRRVPSRTGRNGKDRDYEGLGESAGNPVCCIQLFGDDGFYHDSQVFQGLGFLRSLVLL